MGESIADFPHFIEFLVYCITLTFEARPYLHNRVARAERADILPHDGSWCVLCARDRLTAVRGQIGGFSRTSAIPALPPVCEHGEHSTDAGVVPAA
jgi:hypothetical protein